jgi:hypothetical protein
MDQSPTLLFIGVYDGNGSTPAPMVMVGSTMYMPGGVGDWGETSDMIGFTSGDAYVDVGLTDPNGGHSESFGNWSGADVAAGFSAPTSFEIFGFALNTALMGNTGTEISLTGVPNGSFVIGFSCKQGGPGTSGICKGGDISSTPFTNAGLVDVHTTSTPEPTSLMLLGSGITFLGLRLRRKSN